MREPGPHFREMGQSLEDPALDRARGMPPLRHLPVDPGAVSYTHLDVYKRQRLCSINITLRLIYLLEYGS